MPPVRFYIPTSHYDRVMSYLQKRCKEEYVAQSAYIANLVMKDYHNNINTVEATGLQYTVDITNNTMSIEIPPQVREILNLKEKTVLVNLK